MHFGLFSRGEESCGLYYHIYRQIFPRQSRRIFLGKNLDRLSIDNNMVFIKRDLFWISPVHRIVFEKIRKSFSIGKIVDGHYRKLVLIECGPEKCTPDAAKPIDCDVHRRNITLPIKKTLDYLPALHSKRQKKEKYHHYANYNK